MQKKTKKIIISSILLLTILLIVLLQQKSSKISQVQEQTAKATVYTRIGEQEFDITNLIEQNPIPTVSAGMIPVKWDGEYWKITTKEDTEWYDYTNGKPAYMMLNDGVYQSEEYYNMPTSKKLAKDNIGTQISNEDLGSIYMWIPKFAYNESGEIIYIKQEASVAGEYTIPDMFKYELNNENFLLSGIWVEINELENATKTNEKVTNLNKGENNDVYGFLSHTKATKMTDDAKTAIQTYIEYIDENVGASIARLQITTANHTILRIIDTTKTEAIKGTATYNALTEKVEIEIIYHKNDIVKILNSSGKEMTYTNEEKTMANSGDDIIGNGKYSYIVIDSMGNMKVVSVEVSGLSIYVIPNLETLKQFRDDVNANKVPAGTKVFQTADIKINEGKYTYNEQTGVITFAQDAEKFTPIGYSNYFFKGIYDGQGYSISGLYISENSNYLGLFRQIQSDGCIKNLNIKDSYISGNSYVGGIVGQARGNATILNCTYKGNVAGGTAVAGIAGYVNDNVNIQKCANFGKISGGSSTGGVLGQIVGGTCRESYNLGDINGSNYVGGIAGYGSNGDYGGVYIIGCYNRGNVRGSDYVGGIAGWGYNAQYCYNSGNVSGWRAGGIVGYVNKFDLRKLYNYGAISGSGNTGGICGTINMAGTIKNCINMGNVGYAIAGYYRANGANTIGELIYLVGASSKVSGYDVLNASARERENIPNLVNYFDDSTGRGIFVEDTEGINGGYPLLAWQIE